MLDYSFNEFVIINNLYFVFHYLFKGRFFFFLILKKKKGRFFLKDFLVHIQFRDRILSKKKKNLKIEWKIK